MLIECFMCLFVLAGKSITDSHQDIYLPGLPSILTHKHSKLHHRHQVLGSQSTPKHTGLSHCLAFFACPFWRPYSHPLQLCDSSNHVSVIATILYFSSWFPAPPALYPCCMHCWKWTSVGLLLLPPSLGGKPWFLWDCSQVLPWFLNYQQLLLLCCHVDLHPLLQGDGWGVPHTLKETFQMCFSVLSTSQSSLRGFTWTLPQMLVCHPQAYP